MTEHRGRTRGLLIGLGAAVAAVVVVALVAVFARGGAATFDPASPEGVVQQYSRAVIDGDADAAKELLVPEEAEACEDTGIPGGDMRVTHSRTREDGDRVRVDVVVTSTYGYGPLGADEYSAEGTFRLERVDGDWRIATTPWELAVCYDTGADR